MIAITHIPPTAPGLDTLAADDLLRELRGTTRERAALEARRDRLTADLARQDAEARAAVAQAQELWGASFRVAPAGDREGADLRAELAEAEVRLPVIDARRAETVGAVRRRIARHEAAIAAERAALPEATADLARRHERLCELWGPLAAFEELPDDAPPTGATQRAALALQGRREALDRHERGLARLRKVVDEACAAT